MREDDLVCTADYKRLPQNFKTILWEIKREFKPVKLSMVVDWLREHPLEEDMECKDNA